VHGVVPPGRLRVVGRTQPQLGEESARRDCKRKR
jgi:hypothetical protein